MSTICSILNMPQPMSKQACSNHINVLYDAHKQTIEKCLASTREKLRSKLKKGNPDISDYEILDIDKARLSGSARRASELPKKEKSCPKAGKTCAGARSKRKRRWSILCLRSF